MLSLTLTLSCALVSAAQLDALAAAGAGTGTSEACRAECAANLAATVVLRARAEGAEGNLVGLKAATMEQTSRPSHVSPSAGARLALHHVCITSVTLSMTWRRV
jgi:hypothetical protein